MEFDGDTAADLSHRYLWGDAVDQLLADETVDDGGAEDVLWTLTDWQGTVRDLATYDTSTDTTTIANHKVYDAYGNVYSETDDTVDTLFGYTARLWDDDIDLQWNLNRWYDPATSRWVSEDPIGFAAGDPNLYRYVGNSPGMGVDPSGLEETWHEQVRTIVGLMDPNVGTWFDSYVGDSRRFQLRRMSAEYFRWSKDTVQRSDTGALGTFVFEDTVSPTEAAEFVVEQFHSGLDFSSAYWMARVTNATLFGNASHVSSRAQREQEIARYNDALPYVKTIAHLYVEGVLSFNPGADCAVTISDIAENGFQWYHALSALPYVPAAVRGAGDALLSLSGKSFAVSYELAERFSKLPRQVQERIARLVGQADNAEAASWLLRREVLYSGAERMGRLLDESELRKIFQEIPDISRECGEEAAFHIVRKDGRLVPEILVPPQGITDVELAEELIRFC